MATKPSVATDTVTAEQDVETTCSTYRPPPSSG